MDAIMDLVLDDICRRETAFCSFQELLTAKGNYRPSLNVNKPNLLYLANHYDMAQEDRGDSRRAYRWS